MRVIHDLAQVRPASRAYVTIGVLDGVHRGHQQLVTAMVEAAHSAQDTAIAITFDPRPAVTLGYAPPLLLTTTEERAELLATLGLDVLVVLPFTPAMARTSANDFVEALIHHLHLAELWGGADFALGHRREGNVSFLQRLGEERGFTMRIVEPVMWAGTPVSSSRIRTALEAGDIDQATTCLGRPYRLTGAVVQGRGVGRCMEVPTTNLSPPSERLIPAGGVYACLAHTEHLGTHPAVVNIGTRPTFAQENLSSLAAPVSGVSPQGRSSELIRPVPRQTMTIEAHLLDFDADVYGQTLSLDFVARLRDERPFPTPDALVAQIQKDIAQARDCLSEVSCHREK